MSIRVKRVTGLLAHIQGNGDLEVSPPETLSFSSPNNDAAITFINSTSLNGVIFQHGRAFNIVASADFLVVLYCTLEQLTPKYVSVKNAIAHIFSNSTRDYFLLVAPGATQCEMRRHAVCQHRQTRATTRTQNAQTAFIN